MYNVIKCPNCGAENRAGEVSCSHCNTRFQYKCPRCQSVITGGDLSCSRCGQPLNWPTREPGSGGDKEKQLEERKSGSLRSWLIPLAGLVLVLAAAGAGVYWVKMMAEEPPRPAITGGPDAIGDDSVFTPDISAPRISNIKVTNVNFNTVKITWETDELSNSQLIWRIKDGVPQSSELKEARDTSHFIELTGLKSKSVYYYKVQSVDQAENESLSAEKTFSIGIERGTLKVEVVTSGYQVIEPQPSVFKTIINGEIKNTGEATLSIREIEVLVTVTVSGKPGTSVVQASLYPSPPDIYPQALHKFTAEVPNRTEPVYKVEARIIQE
jgi:hypothetical protein